MEPAAIRHGAPFDVQFTLDIEEGWHINANRATSPNLFATTVDVRSTLPIEVTGVQYPEPVSLSAAYAESPIAIYDGRVEIIAHCRLKEQPEGETINDGTIRAMVAFQACDDRFCYPGSVSKTLTMRILPSAEGATDSDLPGSFCN